MPVSSSSKGKAAGRKTMKGSIKRFSETEVLQMSDLPVGIQILDVSPRGDASFEHLKSQERVQTLLADQSANQIPDSQEFSLALHPNQAQVRAVSSQAQHQQKLALEKAADE